MAVPKLRFKEFKDEYISTSINNIAEITMGQSPNSVNYTSNTTDIILIQGNADLNNGKIQPRLYTTEITKMCEINDIIMTVRAPVGDLAITEYKACIGRGVCSIRGSKYLYYYLQNFKYNGEWKKLSKGSTIDSITSNDLKNINIILPDKFEQEKIANFLSLLDKKIELQKQKIDALKIYKIGLFNKIYKEEMNTIKEEEIKKYAYLQGGYAFKSELVSKKGIPIIRIANINESIVDLKDIVFYDKEISIDSKFEINTGDILIAMSGATTGKIGIYKETMKSYLNQRVGKIVLKRKDIVYSYLYFLFELSSYNMQLNTKLVAGAQPNISPSDIETLKFKVPSTEMQEHIANMAMNINKKLEIEGNKLQELNKIKKGLLQKMFI